MISVIEIGAAVVVIAAGAEAILFIIGVVNEFLFFGVLGHVARRVVRITLATCEAIVRAIKSWIAHRRAAAAGNRGGCARGRVESAVAEAIERVGLLPTLALRTAVRRLHFGRIF